MISKVEIHNNWVTFNFALKNYFEIKLWLKASCYRFIHLLFLINYLSSTGNLCSTRHLPFCSMFDGKCLYLKTLLSHLVGTKLAVTKGQPSNKSILFWTNQHILIYAFRSKITFHNEYTFNFLHNTELASSHLSLMSVQINFLLKRIWIFNILWTWIKRQMLHWTFSRAFRFDS